MQFSLWQIVRRHGRGIVLCSRTVLLRQLRVRGERCRQRSRRNIISGLEFFSPNCSDLRLSRPRTFRKYVSAPHTTIRSGTSEVYTINHYPKTTFHATITLDLYKLDILNRVFCLPVSRPLTNDVTRHAAPSLEGFQHFRFYCSNFGVKNLLIIADILVITYS